jgi:hypothetical protein
MEKKEMQIAIHDKNEIIIDQSRRIRILEDKITEIRKLYFKLKYADVLINLKGI